MKRGHHCPKKLKLSTSEPDIFRLESQAKNPQCQSELQSSHCEAPPCMSDRCSRSSTHSLSIGPKSSHLSKGITTPCGPQAGSSPGKPTQAVVGEPCAALRLSCFRLHWCSLVLLWGCTALDCSGFGLNCSRVILLWGVLLL